MFIYLYCKYITLLVYIYFKIRNFVVHPNAVITNLSVNVANVGLSRNQQQQARTDRISLMNRNLRARNKLWWAGETSVSEMRYQEKISQYFKNNSKKYPNIRKKIVFLHSVQNGSGYASFEGERV